MTHKHTKGQGQRSPGWKVRVETDGQTDGRTEAIVGLFSRGANAVGKYTDLLEVLMRERPVSRKSNASFCL